MIEDEDHPAYKHRFFEWKLADAWKRRAAEIGAPTDRPRRLSEMTPQERARFLLDEPVRHGGGCPCASCCVDAMVLLDELVPGWFEDYRHRASRR